MPPKGKEKVVSALPMSNTLLALDQSSHITGWAIFKNGKLDKYGKFSIEDENLGVRLTKLREEINNLIDIYKPNEVVYEEIQEQNNIQTFKVLAQVQGVILELLNSLNIPYSIMPSATWKSALGIKGRARAEQKRNAQQYVENNYNIKVIQDIADAICIGIAHLKKNQCAW